MSGSSFASSPSLSWDTTPGLKGHAGFTSAETLPSSATTAKSWYVLRFRTVECHGDLNTISYADILCLIDPTEPISTCVDRLKSQVMATCQTCRGTQEIAGTFLRIPRPGKTSLTSVAMGLYELVVYLREQSPARQLDAWEKLELFGNTENNVVYVYFETSGDYCSDDEDEDGAQGNEVRRVLEWRERVYAESDYLGNRTIEKGVDLWAVAWSVGFWGVGLMLVFGVSSLS